MQKIHIKPGPPGGNLLINVLVVIVGAVVLTASLILGFVAFVALSAVVLVTAAVIAIRGWWLGRGQRRPAPTGPTASGDTIEGEFHVVKQDKNS